jgi:hypothetical protein
MKRIFKALGIAILGIFYNVSVPSNGNVIIRSKLASAQGSTAFPAFLLRHWYDVRKTRSGFYRIKLKSHNREDNP